MRTPTIHSGAAGSTPRVSGIRDHRTSSSPLATTVTAISTSADATPTTTPGSTMGSSRRAAARAGSDAVASLVTRVSPGESWTPPILPAARARRRRQSTRRDRGRAPCQRVLMSSGEPHDRQAHPLEPSHDDQPIQRRGRTARALRPVRPGPPGRRGHARRSPPRAAADGPGRGRRLPRRLRSGRHLVGDGVGRRVGAASSTGGRGLRPGDPRGDRRPVPGRRHERARRPHRERRRAQRHHHVVRRVLGHGRRACR